MNYKRGRPKDASRACRMCGYKENKRDGNTVAAIDVVKQHDARCPEAPDVSRLAPAGRFKKNTRKWCLGKVGREHRLIWRKTIGHYGPSYTAEQVCASCGKVMDWCYHRGQKWGWMGSMLTKPCKCGIKEWGK